MAAAQPHESLFCLDPPRSIPYDLPSCGKVRFFHVVLAGCDYIAGMTDPFAVERFKELFIPMGWTLK